MLGTQTMNIHSNRERNKLHSYLIHLIRLIDMLENTFRTSGRGKSCFDICVGGIAKINFEFQETMHKATILHSGNCSIQ